MNRKGKENYSRTKTWRASVHFCLPFLPSPSFLPYSFPPCLFFLYLSQFSPLHFFFSVLPFLLEPYFPPFVNRTHTSRWLTYMSQTGSVDILHYFQWYERVVEISVGFIHIKIKSVWLSQSSSLLCLVFHFLSCCTLLLPPPPPFFTVKEAALRQNIFKQKACWSPLL